jgi:hypothetical protein
LERWKLQLPLEVILLPDGRGAKEQSHINIAGMEEEDAMEARNENGR